MRGAMMTMMMYDLLIFILTWMNVWVKWKLWHVACGDVLGSWCHIEWWHGWIRRCKSGTNGQIEFEFGHQLVVTCTHSSCAGVTHCLVCLPYPPHPPHACLRCLPAFPQLCPSPKMSVTQIRPARNIRFQRGRRKVSFNKIFSWERSKLTTSACPNWYSSC